MKEMLTTSPSTLLLLSQLLLLSPHLLSVDTKSIIDFIGGKKISRQFFYPNSHMINEDTPPKLREIIMDTWPQLYWLKDQKKDNKNDNKYTKYSSTEEGVV